MGYKDPKTEGPAAHAVSAKISLVNKQQNLADVQTLSIFAELARKAPNNFPTPAQAQWTKWIKALQAEVQDTGSLSTTRRNTLTQRAAKALDGLPSARTWYALQTLSNEAQMRTQALSGYLTQIGRINGLSPQGATDEFWTRHSQAGTARSNLLGRKPRSLFEGHVPGDYATVTVLTDMRREAVQTADIRPTQHISLEGTMLQSYGYETATERLEVNIGGAVYAYRVPTLVAEKLQTMTADQAERFITETIFTDEQYAWTTAAGATRMCPACAAPVGQVHICKGPASAPYAEGVLVDLDPGAERVASDGTVLVVLRSDVRMQLMTQGEVEVPVVVMTAPDLSLEGFASRHLVTGNLVLGNEGYDASGLQCSCPVEGCGHGLVAGAQVREMVVAGTVPAADEVLLQTV